MRKFVMKYVCDFHEKTAELFVVKLGRQLDPEKYISYFLSRQFHWIVNNAGYLKLVFNIFIYELHDFDIGMELFNIFN